MQQLLLTSPVIGYGGKIGFAASLLLVSSAATVFSFQSPTKEKIKEIEAINQPVKEFFNSTISGAFTEVGQGIYSQYKNWFGEEIKSSLEKENLKKLSDKFKEWAPGIKSVGTTIHGAFKSGIIEEVNYYLFQLGGIIKAVIRNIPLIARDSIISEAKGNESSNGKVLFGYEEIKKLVTNEKAMEFFESIKNVISSHGKVLDNFTYQDGRAIINAFKHLAQRDESGIKNGFSNLVNNAKEVNKKEYTAQQTQELLKDLFLGQGWKEMKKHVAELKKQIENMKTQIKSLIGEKTNIEVFEKILEGLEKELPVFAEENIS
ncbi:hypothetical protein MHSWG343_04780 [Candidatus Mycoplasma haematohominis]|uniref:Uncharacterized protein n=1 Tax=Candidatus Mycoplasma haematohominis TaxID=1494318 RepID=A0A478FPW8_9MOLU|nr:hypothetical protein MHSWG343_04780 [Candidatus Mycoplasma haemohominis]